MSAYTFDYEKVPAFSDPQEEARFVYKWIGVDTPSQQLRTVEKVL